MHTVNRRMAPPPLADRFSNKLMGFRGNGIGQSSTQIKIAADALIIRARK
jgi:hypothetical protein